MTSVNIWPILVASVVAFAVSALWYSPILFGKEWMALMKISESDISAAKQKGGMWGLYLTQFVFTIMTFCVLGFIISATTGLSSASDGAFLGFLAWLGFALPIGVSSLLWEKRSFKLVLINTISTLLNLLVGGAIIAAWR